MRRLHAPPSPEADINPKPRKGGYPAPNRVIFLTGANRDFPNWRRHWRSPRSRLNGSRRSSQSCELWIPRAVAWLVRLYRLAGLQYVELKNSDLAIERFKLGLGARAFSEAKQPTPSIEYEAALVYANMLWVDRGRGNTDAAGAAKQDA